MLAIKGMQGLGSGFCLRMSLIFPYSSVALLPRVGSLLGWSWYRRPLKLNKMSLSQAKYCFKKYMKKGGGAAMAEPVRQELSALAAIFCGPDEWEVLSLSEWISLTFYQLVKSGVKWCGTHQRGEVEQIWKRAERFILYPVCTSPSSRSQKTAELTAAPF